MNIADMSTASITPSRVGVGRIAATVGATQALRTGEITGPQCAPKTATTTVAFAADHAAASRANR
jgi:hypothetical protein